MKDFAAMNEVWCKWVDPNNKPARACVEAPMAAPNILFEVRILFNLQSSPCSAPS